MMKKTALLLPAIALIAATSVQAQTSVITNAYAGGSVQSGSTVIFTNGASITGNITDNGELVFKQSSAIEMLNSISGTGSLAQSGSGTTILGDNNNFFFPNSYTFTGGVTVNSGTLIIGKGLANNASNTITINGGTLSLNKQDIFTDWKGTVSNAITINSGGVLANDGTNFNTLGAVTLNGGSIQSLGTNGANASGTAFGLKGNVTVAGSGTSTIAGPGIALGENTVTDTRFRIMNGGTLNVSGNLVNGDSASWGTKQASSLTVSLWAPGGSSDGTGIMILSGTNSYTGTTTITSTTLQIGNGGASGNLGTNSVINNGTLAFGRSDSYAYSNATTGSGTISQVGTGTTTLVNGNPSTTGGVKVSAGALNIGNGGSSNLVVGTGSGASGNLSISNGTINNSNGVIASAAGSTGSALVSGGNWNNSGNLTIGNSGAGTLTLMNGGTVTAGNGSGTITLASGAGSVGTLILGTNAGVRSQNVGTIAASMVTGGSGTATVTFNNGSVIPADVFAPTLAGSLSVAQVGTGTTVLTANNTYTGSTTLSNGVLQIGNGGISGSLGSGSVTGTSGALQFNRSDTVTITNNMSGIHLRQAGSGTTVLATSSDSFSHLIVLQGTLMTASNRSFSVGTLGVGANSGDNGTLLIQGQGAVSTTNGGGLAVGSSGSTGSVVVNGGALNVWQINMRGTSSLTVSGASTVTSRGAQIGNAIVGASANSSVAMSGGLWTNTGDMTIGQSGNCLGSLSISGAGSLINNGRIYVGVNGGEGSIMVSGGSLTNYGSLNIGFANEYGTRTGTGSLNVTGGSVFNSGDGIIGAYKGSTGSADISGGSWSISPFSNANQLYVGSGGTGSLTLSGTGTVIVGVSGVVTLAKDSNSVGTLNLGNGGSSVGTLSAGTVTGGSGNATVNVNSSGNANLGQNFTGSLAFNQIGTGTTTLVGANTYTGLTKVSAGTLALGAGGSLATNNSVQIDSGAKFDLAANSQSLNDVKANGTIAGSGMMTVAGTLSGSGTVAADTVVTGIHSPGNSPGIQSFGGNLTYNTGAGILLQFTGNTTNNSPVNYDQIMVGKNLNFNGLTTLNLDFGETGSVVDWNNAFWQNSQSWTLYSVSGITTGFGNLTLNSTNWSDANGLLFSDVLSGGNFSLTQNGQDIVLNYAIPEPSTYALIGLGALVLVIAARRKRA